MDSNDTYRSFAELSRREREGQDWRRILRRRQSAFAILAPHGGGIEPGTSEIAIAVAGTEHSIYCFEGIKRRGNQSMHITSGRFDDPICVELTKSVRTVVTVHGCNDKDDIVYVGGLHTELKASAIDSLSAVGFSAVEDTTDHDGTAQSNICNQGFEARGLQFEISLGTRMTMFAGLRASERRLTTDRFVAFVSALRTVFQSNP